MPGTRTMTGRAALMAHGPDPRCGDCEHFDEEGCGQAAEALVLEGWPRAAVLLDVSAEAGRCPEYSPSEGFRLEEDEEDGCREAYARVAAIRNFSSW